MRGVSVLLGLLFGPVALGLYSLADRFMSSVVAMATTSIQAVSLPEFSRVQGQPEALKKSALSCIRLSATVTLPALAGLAAVSGPLMATIGPNWIPAVGVLKILCVLGMCLVLSFFTGPLLQALARTRQLAVLAWVRGAIGLVFLGGAGLLAKNGSIGRQIVTIAIARFIPTVLFVTHVFLYILMKLCQISVRDLVRAMWHSSLASSRVVVAGI